MKQEPKYLTMEELSRIELDNGRYTRIIPGRHLKYNAPGEEGLGFSAVPLLYPNSVLLFVGPPGCGRHVKIGAYRLALQGRLFLLQITEPDMVTGNHLARIPTAVDEILARLQKKPDAFFISSSCVDTIMGSDYRAVCRNLSERHPDIRFAPAYMDPVMFDSKLSPDRTVQISMLELIEKQEYKDRGVNIIGALRPLETKSQLVRALTTAGFGPVRQLCGSGGAEAVTMMGRSILNIACGPSTGLAVDLFQKKHGTPWIMLPFSHDLRKIRAFYKELGSMLGVEIDDSGWYQEAEGKLRAAAEACTGKKIAIGKGFFGNPFETAAVLLSFGFSVEAVVKNKIIPQEMAVIGELAAKYPNVKVYSGDHPTLNVLHRHHSRVDIAVGGDMIYFYPEAAKILTRKDTLPIGYEAVGYLADALRKAAEG